jgi:predicted N-acetyltransferase YhbS
MDVRLRPGTPDDAETCGRICYEAFTAIKLRHDFALEFADPEAAVAVLSELLRHPGLYSVVAECDGRMVGSNFLDERAGIVGVGPITVDPAVQDAGVGRALMRDVMRRATERAVPGIRLVQDAYHDRSLWLYAKLGFELRAPLVCLQGAPPRGRVSGHQARRATSADVEECHELCRREHGHDRGGQLTDAVAQGTAMVVEHDGRVTGYASDLAWSGHAVGESNEDLKALMFAADAFGGPGIIVPSTNAGLFRWCLDQGLRVIQMMNLMTVGLYAEPRGAYLAGIMY